MSETVTGALCRARDHGVAAIGEIADRCSCGDASVRQQVTRYLRENIGYHLGDAHQRALERFYASVVRRGLAPETRALRFAPRASEVARP
jgi:hypothetical protein